MTDGCGRLIGPYPCCSIVTGDARELAPAIPDESVDLIFTDPVYDRIEDYRWLAETAARVLKDGTSCLAFCGNESVLSAGSQMQTAMTFQRVLTIFHSGVTVGSYVGRIFSKTSQCLHFSKNSGQPKRMMWDISVGVSNKAKYGDFHLWGKDPKTVERWAGAFTVTGDLILDPFTGGGTVPAVCKMLGRHYLAFEIDPDVAERARERVRNTQPPLFVMQPEQTEMKITDT